VGVPSRRISSCILGCPKTRVLQISPTTNKILAVVILFHTENGLPIKFPNLGEIMNEEDLEDVWFHVINARGFLRNLQGVN
jgi:hypothetical protein